MPILQEIYFAEQKEQKEIPYSSMPELRFIFPAKRSLLKKVLSLQLFRLIPVRLLKHLTLLSQSQTETEIPNLFMDAW